MAEGNQNQHFELPPEPQQQVETAPDQAQAVEAQTAPLETVGKAQEQAKQPRATTAPQDDTQDDNQGDSQAVAAPAPAAPQSADDQAVAKMHANDGDLIEKEWVDRAKSIIKKTADDPHKQKHEVSKMKAAYIQKRFNKIIKTDEATA